MDEKILPGPQMLMILIIGLYILIIRKQRLSLRDTHAQDLIAQGFCRVFIN